MTCMLGGAYLNWQSADHAEAYGFLTQTLNPPQSDEATGSSQCTLTPPPTGPQLVWSGCSDYGDLGFRVAIYLGVLLLG